MFVTKNDLDQFFTEHYGYLQAFTNKVTDGFTVDTTDIIHDAYQKMVRSTCATIRWYS